MTYFLHFFLTIPGILADFADDNQYLSFETPLRNLWNNSRTTLRQIRDNFDLTLRQFWDIFETTFGPHGDYLLTIGGAYLCLVGSIWTSLYVWCTFITSSSISGERYVSDHQIQKRHWKRFKGYIFVCLLGLVSCWAFPRLGKPKEEWDPWEDLRL